MTSTGLPILEQVRLNKAATDAGFDVRRGSIGNWLLYSSTSCPLQIALSTLDARPVAALSMLNVLEELALPTVGIDLPDGAAGAVGFVTFDQLQAALQRAYELAKALPHELLRQWEKAVAGVPQTERDAAVKQRVGQNLFRSGLLALWGGRCALTRLDVAELLRASHAKPWAVASDSERLDVYNGVLLAAHLDAAFDKGLISFGDDGALLVSSRLDHSARELLGLDRRWPNVLLRAQHRPYMAYHREHLFVP